MVDTRVLIGQGLDAVAEALQPIVAQRFSQLLPGVSDWTRVLREKDEQNGRRFESYNPADLLLLLRAITERFGSIGYPFQDLIARQTSNCASELRTVRNRWAHNETFSAAEAYRALDTAALLLSGINAATQGAKLAALKLEALTAMQPFVERPAETPKTVPASMQPSTARHAEPAAPLSTAADPEGSDAPRGASASSVAGFDVSAVDVLSYALAHCSVAIVNEITINYRGAELRGASVEVEALSPMGALGDPKVLLVDLDGENNLSLKAVAFTLDSSRMLALDTQHEGSLRLTLRGPDDQVITEHQHAVRILASNQWIGRPLQLGLELIAAFVQPNASEIEKLAGEASELLGKATGNSALDGYQSGSPERIDAAAKAVYDAMQARSIRYAEPPASWGLNGQKVRTPEEVLCGRLGTCLDTTVTFAAVLEEMGINSTLWFVPGHVFLGYWRYESSLDTPAEVDASEAINYVGLGSLRLIETTSVPLGESFETAARRPMLEHLSKGASHFDGVTDIQQARLSGIHPLPSRSFNDSGELVVREYRIAASSPALEYLPEVSSSDGNTQRRLPTRVVQWKNALLDLSLRNRLINYSGRAGHALEVPQPKLGDFEDLINSGAAVTLVPSDRIPEIDRSRGIRSGRELPETALAVMLDERKQVFIDLREEAYSSRLRALAYKARTIVEETGANNLYLALGMLRWDLAGRELRSPLILVPVMLTSSARGQGYRISLDDAGESTPNYCLLEKLRVSLGLEIPGLANPAHDESGIDLAAALAATRRALADAKLPFTVEDSVELAILQFAKFRLWKDVDENWDAFTSNPLVDHLVHSPTETFSDPAATPANPDLDAVITELPVSADSSQADAVVEAAAGRTFVLEGPPGTGKSQTITNLLAHSIAQGKRVLFVAEKRAALDVVKQRLEAVGLGQLSLDLHDKGARPTAVRAQISAALEAAFIVDEARLSTNRETNQSSASSLRRYAERLHKPNAFGLSLYSARDRLLASEDDTPSLPVPVAFIRRADKTVAERIRASLRSLPETADLAKPAPVHPWGFIDFSATTRSAEDIYAAAREFDRTLGDLINAGVDQATLHLIEAPEQIEAWANLCRAPRFSLEAIDAVRPRIDSGDFAELRRRFAQIAESLPAWSASVGVECLSSNVQEIHAHAMAADGSGIFGRKKRQRAVLREFGEALRVDPRSVHPKAVSQLTFEIAQTAYAIDDLVRLAMSLPFPLVHADWNPHLDPGAQPALATLDWLKWLIPILTRNGPFSEPLRVELRNSYAGSSVDLNLAEALSNYAAAWRRLDALAGANDRDGALAAWSAGRGLVNTWAATRGQRRLDADAPISLQRWLDFLQQLEPIRQEGLSEAHEILKTGMMSADDAALAFDRGLAASTIEEREEAEGLTAFDAASHNRSITRFTRSSSAIREELPRWIPQQIVAQRRVDPRYNGGAMGELKRQLGRKRGGMSIRALFEHFESIILQISPCVLMSPESVARFFPAKSDMFDIVVFDEASQIRVADSVGAMGRGRSVVVVGDSRQMPPTNFAEPQIHEGDSQVEDGETVVDEESILTECVQARVPQKWLSWHYRSQDETLISFSNHTYYDSRLSSFPAPPSPSHSASHGISLVRVDGHFNRSGKGKLLRTNQIEAQAIVDEVARRFARNPAESPSLGIITFNAQQRVLIETMLRDHHDERLAAALDERDGLFVKNLENVQGDERDTILFSVAFSKNDRGVVPLNFGPLTRAGGERRLNVAITRARRQVVLYSSFDPGDLRTENTLSVGIKHLKAYMELADAGIRGSSLDASVQPLTDRHRDEIAAELRLRGFAVQTDLGLSDFRIDISVATAEEPERQLLAVLLDGESWRSRRTVADRDGLPVEVLENLMRWPAVERVWLPEWLQDRETTLDRLAAAVSRTLERQVSSDPFPLGEEAGQAPATDQGHPEISRETTLRSSLRHGADLDPAPSPTSAPDRRSAIMELPSTRIQHERLTPFVPWTGTAGGGVDVLDALPRMDAARQVREVIRSAVAAEGPVHAQRLAKLVGESFGLSRVASGRVSSILACVPSDLPRSENAEFIWPAEIDPKTYTTARHTGGELRREIDSVPLEEIANAMAIVSELSGGMETEAIQREALALFGGKRITSGIARRLEAALALGEDSGRLRRVGTVWRTAD
ncbi:DUF3320 domain-containing protein [Leucobacter tenebrionis]|uniref:DUF3320 domain-containing protein n=1 Tax=Leucobacter tenebrionis TaxID=2873270 RepID=UPI001CA5F5DA|nr:DUF3320 domain-containing protein [Leucobacter tenebrionis]QZY51764.1 DUF3320 domain-containing protein [Leucobacter tenebrionis]